MRAIDADAFAEFLKDTVKRQKYENTKIDGLLTVADVIEAVISELDGTSFVGFKNAPTIELQRKKGKWLFKERREPVYDLSGVKTWGIAYMCSECGFIHTVIEDFGQYAYCPNSNCGAEMEGQDDSI